MNTNYIKLVNEHIDKGGLRGHALFEENLEIDIQKDVMYEEYGLDAILEQQFKDAGIDLISEDADDELTEDELNALLDDIDNIDSE